MKFCNRCQTEKPREEFHKRSGVANGLQGKCKECSRQIARAREESGRAADYREQNREKTKKSNREYYKNNRQQQLEQKKAYYLANKELILQKRKESQPKTNERVRLRMERMPELKAVANLRARVTHAARTMKAFITCGKALRGARLQVKERIEFNFKPGMSWDNYGQWHIDHVKPVAAFMVQGLDPNMANLLCNLRPEWGPENRKKSALFKGINYRIPFKGKSAQNGATTLRTHDEKALSAPATA